MKISIALILASSALLGGSTVFAKETVCHDSNGHFRKCPPAAGHAPAAHAAATAHAPTAAHATAASHAPTVAHAPAVTHATVTRTTVLHRTTQATVPAPKGRPTFKCKDGSFSYSKNRSGSCSGHGGIAK